MHIYKVGDKGKALCDTCKGVVDTTYQLRDLPMSDGHGVARGVLAIVCDSCHHLCGFPQQSLVRVQQAVEKRESIESRVPVQIDDIFNLACEKLQATPDFRSSLIRYYARKLAQDQATSEGLEALLQDALASGKSTSRISVKGALIKRNFETIEKAAHLKSHAEVMKVIAVKVKYDLLDEANPESLQELRNIASVA